MWNVTALGFADRVRRTRRVAHVVVLCAAAAVDACAVALGALRRGPLGEQQQQGNATEEEPRHRASETAPPSGRLGSAGREASETRGERRGVCRYRTMADGRCCRQRRCR
eukprot:6567624-Prymnesium_polylepis.2